MRVYALMSVTISVLLAASASAQQTGDPVPLQGVSEDLWSVLFKLAVAVVVIVALIYVTMLLLRKLSLGRAGIMGSKGSLEIIERSYFAPKKSVCLMRVGTKVFVVGVSDAGINMLADVSDQEFEVLAKRKQKQKTLGFKAHLQQAMTHLSTLVSKH